MSASKKKLRKELADAKNKIASLSKESKQSNPSHQKPNQEPKNGILRFIKTHKVTSTLCGLFVFSLNALFNFFGSNPRMLYLPAITGCAVVCWVIISGTHRYVCSKVAQQNALAIESQKPATLDASHLQAAVEETIRKSLANIKASPPDDIGDAMYPGFSAHFLMRLGNPVKDRDNYICDLGEIGSARASLFFDKESNLCFRTILSDGHESILHSEPGLQNFTFGATIYVVCEFAISKTFFFTRLFINGNLVAQYREETSVHDQDLLFEPILGSDLAKTNGGVFDLLVFGTQMNTINREQSIKYLSEMNNIMKHDHKFLAFSGHQWIKLVSLNNWVNIDTNSAPWLKNDGP